MFSKQRWRRFVTLIALLSALFITLSACAKPKKAATAQTIRTDKLRATTFALVASAENSTLRFDHQYRYIEDIGDGRGYTGGIIGFTSGTGDMLKVVQEYVRLRPKHNALKRYLPALKRVNGTASHKGLGQQFEIAWRKAGQTHQMIHAQNTVLDHQYLNVALRYAKKDHLRPLGQYIYYDALVVHGPGSAHDKTSFQGIRKRALKRAKTPAKGGKESTYLNAFLKARTPVMKSEAAHSDLSRLNTQQRFINEHKFNLQLPLSWTMYGDHYKLTNKKAEQLARTFK
ncbi:MAG TPA: chitosanase [Lactobacillus sp.]|nr:chitosanase [Lactobacillus sp.]